MDRLLCLARRRHRAKTRDGEVHEAGQDACEHERQRDHRGDIEPDRGIDAESSWTGDPDRGRRNAENEWVFEPALELNNPFDQWT